jgi:PAS domain S-box-containing protein
VTWEWDVESGRVEADVHQASGADALASERLHVREMLSHLHAEDRDAWWQAANQAIETGQPFRALVRRSGAEGQDLWQVMLAQPAERDPATGRVRRFVVASIDVTDHRRAQVDAALWRERVLHVCESLNEALAEWDIGSDRMDWLHAPQGVLGQPIARIGKSADLLPFVHPDDLPAAHAIIVECLKRGPYWHCSLRWRVPDGGYRWLSGQGFVRRNDAGRATHVVGIVYDDDELQRTLERHALQSAMLDRLGEPVIALDDQQRVVVANRALEALLGARPGELLGRPLADLVHRRHRTSLAALMEDRAAIDGGGSLHQRLVMSRLDGSEVAAELSFGRVDIRLRGYWVGVGHDVTQSQRQRRRIMEAVVSEQQRLAIELHDGLSQELTGLSLLLSAITSRHAQDKPIDEDLERAAGLVASAIETTRDVSHGLSAYRVAQGGLASALESLAAATGRRTAVACATRIDTAVSRLIDVPVAHQLARIAQEAVTNAVRHGRPDEIHIELCMQDGSGRLSIGDNGSGIDATAAPRDGMGLQVLRYRADIIGGTLEVAPQAAGGTRVSCIFPLSQTDGSGA